MEGPIRTQTQVVQADRRCFRFLMADVKFGVEIDIEFDVEFDVDFDVEFDVV